MARFTTCFAAVRYAAGLGALLMAASSLSSCGRTAPAPSHGTVNATYDKTTGKLERIAYDRNHDGKPDAWLKMQGTHVISAELDDNFDGAIDRREFYRDASSVAATSASATTSHLPAHTELVRAEQSTATDGKMNRFEVYEHGTLARVEEDTNADGRIDKWETWSAGVLREVALDTKGKGRPDRRLIYAPDGSDPRMEVDTKGDGTFTPSAR